MKRVLSIVAMAIFAVAILVTTGIVDEDYLLLYWVMSSQYEHLQPDKIQKIAEAVSNFDLRALTTLGIPFLRPVLTVYAVKCLVYVMAFAFILAWAAPRIKILFHWLRRAEAGFEVNSAALSNDEKRINITRALRSRAARKRAESYAFLAAALLSLAIAIGFVTRDLGSERPDALDFSATNPDSALHSAEMLIADARMSMEQRLQAAQLLSANRPPPPVAAVDTAEMPREFVAFAKDQLKLIDHQSKLQIIQHTVLAIAIKAAAVILILALSAILVRLYQRGLDLSVEYDGIADAVQLGGNESSMDLNQLRLALTPSLKFKKTEKIPKSILGAFEGIVDRLLKKQTDK